MKRRFLLQATTWLLCFGGWAQGSHAQDTASVFSLSEINWQLDSLLPCHRYCAVDTTNLHRDSLNTFGFAADSLPAYSSDIVAQRLKDLGSPIAFEYNDYVQAYINLYTIKRRQQVERMLGLSYVYFPIFEEVLDRVGAPMELKYLPVVESALNPHAVSRMGATGLWQFMYNTGKLYKLNVTSWVDERRDPRRATEAAVRYLTNMYKTYGDWLLVIAAYNCGPGNVNKAIARSGGKRTFWEIRDHLPRETRGYVPAFIAATYVFNYAGEHNIFPKMVDFSFDTDTVHFTRTKVSLKHIAEITNTDFYLLKDLNPELKQDIVPYSAKPYALRVPMRTGQFFAVYRDSIFDAIAKLNPDNVETGYAANKVSPLTNRAYTKDASKGGRRSVSTASTAGRTLVYHKVRSGEVVSTIAEKYHVSWKQIQGWNGLRGYRIKPGQRLKVYVKNRYASAYKPTKKAKSAPIKLDPNGKYHVVRNGDTLWDIANAYNGLTVDRLKAINNLKGSSLKIGQQLRVQ